MLTQKLRDRIDSVCEPGDRLTASLQELLKLSKIHKLESREQLGLVLTATYLRSPDFAYLVKEASTRQSVSLLTLVHNYTFGTHVAWASGRRTCQPVLLAKQGSRSSNRTWIWRLFGSAACWLGVGSSWMAPWTACWSMLIAPHGLWTWICDLAAPATVMSGHPSMSLNDL